MAILEKKIGTLTVTVDYCDCENDSPREWGCLGVIYSNHRRVQPDGLTVFDCPTNEDGNLRGDKLDELGVWLPLAYYDHSVFRVFVGEPYTDSYRGWDSGNFGVILATKDKIRKEFGCKRITKSIRERVLEALKAEINLLDRYYNGEVYEFTVTDERGECIYSCCGFYCDPEDVLSEGVLEAEYLMQEREAELEEVAQLGMA